MVFQVAIKTFNYSLSYKDSKSMNMTFENNDTNFLKILN